MVGDDRIDGNNSEYVQANFAEPPAGLVVALSAVDEQRRLRFSGEEWVHSILNDVGSLPGSRVVAVGHRMSTSQHPWAMVLDDSLGVAWESDTEYGQGNAYLGASVVVSADEVFAVLFRRGGRGNVPWVIGHAAADPDVLFEVEETTSFNGSPLIGTSDGISLFFVAEFASPRVLEERSAATGRVRGEVPLSPPEGLVLTHSSGAQLLDEGWVLGGSSGLTAFDANGEFRWVFGPIDDRVFQVEGVGVDAAGDIIAAGGLRGSGITPYVVKLDASDGGVIWSYEGTACSVDSSFYGGVAAAVALTETGDAVAVLHPCRSTDDPQRANIIRIAH